MPSESSTHLKAPFTTPATSDMTMDKHGYEMSNVTLGEDKYQDTLESNLDISERRHSSQGESSKDGSKDESKQHAAEVLKEAQAETAEHEEDDTVYPSSWKLLVIVISLCLSILCFALDNTIIATAIPKITDEFPGAIQDVGWYGSAYLLTACSFQLFFGKLYSFFSVKWVYLSAFGLFEVGSVICGAAPNSVALIIGRAVAGLGAAGVFSGAMLIIAASVPLPKRPIYSGLIGGMYGIASVMGPLLGGVFTDHITWRWCFYINLPLGAVTVFFIFFFFKSPPPNQEMAALSWKAKLSLLDLEGTAIFVPGVICALLALQWGGSKYPWSNARIIVLFILFALCMGAFIAIQIWKGDRATVPPRIIKQRSIGASAFFVAMLGGSFFAIIYYVPIWFQAVQNVSATQSGIRNLPLVLSVTVFSIIAGGATTAFGQYAPWIILGSVLTSIGSGLISTFKPTTPIAAWLGYQIIYGAGVGTGIQSPLMAVQVVLDKKDIATGTAIIIFAQTFGGAICIAVAQNVFINKIYSEMARLVPGFSAAIVARTGATELKRVVPAEFYSGVVQAYSNALDSCFYVAVALAALSMIGAVLIEWRSVKGVKIEMGAA